MDSSKIDDALICLRDLVTFSRITKVIEVKIKRFCELFKQICKNWVEVVVVVEVVVEVVLVVVVVEFSEENGARLPCVQM